MQDPKTRDCEKTPEEAAASADFDFPRDPKEFLREIYKEAYNAKQDPDARISKTIGKCSTLFSHLSDNQERIARRLLCVTWALAVLTAVLLILTGYLYCDTHSLLKAEQAHANQAPNTYP